jgi:uncharacterized protein (DUF2267 family)
MDELINQVAQKTGISAEHAKTAVETVVKFLKDKLPAPLAGQLDQLIAGNASSLGDMAKNLGGLFGKSS